MKIIFMILNTPFSRFKYDCGFRFEKWEHWHKSSLLCTLEQEERRQGRA